MAKELSLEEVNKVKRAIIMAAGIGKRMQPLTLEVPKPLVKVNGIRMIDTVVDGLRKNGINEIYVVVGYLKEQFYEWARGQSKVEIIENPYYETCNNISSLYVARDHLEDCIILDGDQIIYNPAILDPSFIRSGYNAVWCEGETDEWLMDVDSGVVRSCSRNGGSHGWQLYSISRWSKRDGDRLKRDLEFEFESGNRDIYWDDVAMFCHFDNYELGIYEMKASDIIEIDSLDELAKLDSKYLSFIDNKK
ncbi:phosphocholine cytidylyltransferase family protein [Butyrivibrio sp. X503]|uniref:NTP transferase domain-containing protein n=1 Tax=Butyrivibrio sp. X503 TaxID=2364878 RepID=UPI000EA9EA9E|nr:phosphocholine cytidylyltransferase family protein [Butyrivibrio sp. X503]RKM54474.1 phosphocholine cytidylyltransferase family protein [Butyrivibrio sp. X503]